MKAWHFLAALSAFGLVSARSIPAYGVHQQPLTANKRFPLKSYVDMVMLAITERGSSSEHRVWVPLQTRILPKADRKFPKHPKTVEIIAVVNQHGQTAPIERFGKILCRCEPEVSMEEKAAVEYGMKAKIWPWFSMMDERIQLDSEESRWFLAGRSVEYYECR